MSWGALSQVNKISPSGKNGLTQPSSRTVSVGKVDCRWEECLLVSTQHVAAGTARPRTVAGNHSLGLPRAK